jgi:hypothetical protein
MPDPNRTFLCGRPARPPVPHTLAARQDPTPLAPSHDAAASARRSREARRVTRCSPTPARASRPAAGGRDPAA